MRTATYRDRVSSLRAAALAGCVALLAGAALPAGAATPVQQTWHADQARVPEARSAGRGGDGVVVAVLDSWVDRAHPDLAGRVLAGADCLGGTCVPGPASADQCDHGTHVSGTVAATSFGVAPRSTVLPVRVLAYDPPTGECVGRPEDVAAGIRWAVAQGARVLNLSLGPDVPGLSGSSAIPAAVAEAAQAGAVVIFSAGNTGLPVTDSYDGDALVVAATGPSGALASYSQRGSGVDLAAPGGDPSTPDVCTREECVLSLFPGNRYSVAAGTSMAAPHVSGVAALLLGQAPGRTREQVVEQLLATARPLAEAGHGSLDASAALGVTGAPTADAPTADGPTTQAQSAPQPVPVEPSDPSAPVTVPAPRRPAAEPVPPVVKAPVPSAPAIPSAVSSPTAPAVPPAPASAAAPAPAIALRPVHEVAERVPAGTAAVAAALLLAAAAGTAYGRRATRR